MGFLRAAWFFVCLSAAAAAGCKNGQQSVPAPSAVEAGTAAVLVPAKGKTVTFRVEVARTPEERERGLMYRDRLAPDAGMLFTFEAPTDLTFWMKNTFIPLDMIFMDGGRKILGIVDNAPPRSLASRGIGQPSQYVLEINGGLSSRLGIVPGGVVEFRGLPPP